MGKNTPPAPDYAGAAQAQGEASRENIAQQTAANRPNQYTPWGATTWESNPVWDPTTGQYNQQWSQNTQLAEPLNEAAQSQMEIAQGRSQMGEDLLGRARDQLGQEADWGSLQNVGSGDQARQRAEDAIYQRSTSRLDPMWEQREGDLQSRLYNQGLREGDAAFDREMGNFGRSRTDAYQGAMDQAIAGGGNEASRQFGLDMQGRQQGISELLTRRAQPLNEINAALSGQQVSMPNMPSFQGAGAAQAPNYLQAAMAQGQYGLDQFNAQQAQTQGMMQGAAMLPFMF
jgi:hypothetical protein